MGKSVIMGFLHGGSFGFISTEGPQGHPSYDTGFSLGVLIGIATSGILILVLWRCLA